jgi:hypothetical protein
MSRLVVPNGSAVFHLYQHVLRVQTLVFFSVNGGRFFTY